MRLSQQSVGLCKNPILLTQRNTPKQLSKNEYVFVLKLTFLSAIDYSVAVRPISSVRVQQHQSHNYSDQSSTHVRLTHSITRNQMARTKISVVQISTVWGVGEFRWFQSFAAQRMDPKLNCFSQKYWEFLSVEKIYLLQVTCLLLLLLGIIINSYIDHLVMWGNQSSLI